MYTISSTDEELRLFKLSVDQSSDEVFWLDFNGNILYVNDAACHITGYSREELCSMKIADLDTEISPGAWEACVADLREQKTHFMTSQHQCKDGRFIDVEILAVSASQKNQEFVFAFVRDITERRKAQEELRAAYHQITATEEKLRRQIDELAKNEQKIRESEEKYRVIFETTGTAALLLENDATISLVNSEFERLSGYTKDEIENKKKWMEFIAKEDLDWMIAQNKRRWVDPEHAPRHYEFRFRTRSGEIRNMFLTIDVIPGTKKIIASLLDLTKLKKAERIIHENEEKYRAVVNMANDGIVIIQDGLFRFVNPKVAEFLEGEEEDFVNSPFTEFIHPRERKRVSEIYRKRMCGETVSPVYETVIIKKDGTPVEVEVNTGIMMFEGKTADLVHIRDISERKRSQKALEQAKKKLNLLNSVTFKDIQNMIYTLSGYQHLIKEKVTESSARSIIEKEDDILQRISNTLKFARSYQDLGLRPPQWQNVRQVFIMAVSHLDFLKIKRSVQLHGLEIFADPFLEQVFLILADNTLTHGKTATQVKLWYTEGQESLTLYFEDNGSGIDEGNKDKIFSQDFQKKKAVGLFLAREILEITGITITETGEAGKGARFEMIIPKGAYRFLNPQAEKEEGS